jgi:protein-L-isoaspartate(D-aspartate) O-methyltransferase
VQDSFKYKGARTRLVEEIQGKGISTPEVLEAIRAIPRHWFVESALWDAAYEDRALPIAEGQTISQPYTVAFQSALLDIRKNMKVLEIGTGSGYQCAVLCALGAKVFTVEVFHKLFQNAQKVLAELDYEPTMRLGDGSVGWDKYAPYDRILVTAACPNIPDALIKQLAVGGKMVLPVGNLDTQEMCLVVKKNATEFETKRFERFKFVPLTGKGGFRI